MRNALLGTFAGLALGTIGALAYSHYLGDGKLLADLQAQLDAANADLTKAAQDKKLLTNETSGVSDQVDQLVKSNEGLKKQLDDLKKAPAVTASAMNPATLGGMMMGMMRGGGQGAQRMFLLQSRLKLTPDQAAKIKAAMDADGKARRDVMQQMFRNNGKIDPQAAANANTLDQTLASVLTPEQQTAYQQVQADEKTSRADTAATVQVNQFAPLLQLSDSQKDQVFSALYQVQMTAPDPTSLITNPNPASAIAAQAQATQDALAKVLTPDQMALYVREGQVMQDYGGPGRFGRGGASNANAAGGAGMPAGGTTTSGYVPSPVPGGAPVFTTVTPQVVTPSGGTDPATSPSTVAPATNAQDGAGATPSATTNAAPAP